jgi:hypothetical protein
LESKQLSEAFVGGSERQRYLRAHLEGLGGSDWRLAECIDRVSR